MNCDPRDTSGDGTGSGLPAGSWPWHAVYTRPRYEFRVREYCRLRQIECFLPTLATIRQWSDRRQKIYQPLFPSYVFVRPRGQQQQRGTVEAPGFVHFIRANGQLALVNDEEVKAVRMLVSSSLPFEALPGAQPGDEVEILRGVLRGFRGRLVGADRRRPLLWVQAIESGVRVTLPDGSWVRLLPKITGKDKPAAP